MRKQNTIIAADECNELNHQKKETQPHWFSTRTMSSTVSFGEKNLMMILEWAILTRILSIIVGSSLSLSPSNNSNADEDNNDYDDSSNNNIDALSWIHYVCDMAHFITCLLFFGNVLWIFVHQHFWWWSPILFSTNKNPCCRSSAAGCRSSSDNNNSDHLSFLDRRHYINLLSWFGRNQQQQRIPTTSSSRATYRLSTAVSSNNMLPSSSLLKSFCNSIVDGYKNIQQMSVWNSRERFYDDDMQEGINNNNKNNSDEENDEVEYQMVPLLSNVVVVDPPSPIFSMDRGIDETAAPKQSLATASREKHL